MPAATSAEAGVEPITAKMPNAATITMVLRMRFFLPCIWRQVLLKSKAHSHPQIRRRPSDMDQPPIHDIMTTHTVINKEAITQSS